MYYSVTPIGSKDSLEHYGVLGMKWGIHRGHSDKVYDKATKKLNKFVSEGDKAEVRAMGYRSKANAIMSKRRPNMKKYNKLMGQVKTAEAISVHSYQKGQKWYNKMDKTLKKAGLSMHENEIKTGKSIAERILEDTRRSSYR